MAPAAFLKITPEDFDAGFVEFKLSYLLGATPPGFSEDSPHSATVAKSIAIQNWTAPATRSPRMVRDEGESATCKDYLQVRSAFPRTSYSSSPRSNWPT